MVRIMIGLLIASIWTAGGAVWFQTYADQRVRMNDRKTSDMFSTVSIVAAFATIVASIIWAIW